MFDEFKQIRTSKRIVSFGGWSFSTEYDTFPIFREGVTPEQRQRFATNVVQVCFFPALLLPYTKVVKSVCSRPRAGWRRL
jgi:hypothetical protein